MTWVLDLGPEAMGHLATALQMHRRKLQTTGVRMPTSLSELQVKCELGATAGQRGTPLADLWEVAQSQNMPAQLMTYETAAAVLSVSPRTVKRLVADGSLTPVHVGSTPRIRVVDLDAYIDGLPAERKAS